MKTFKSPLFLVLIALFVFGQSVLAQEAGNKNVVKETRDLPTFTGISAGGALTVVVEISDIQTVTIETDENLQDKVQTEVKDNVLYIKSFKLKNPSKLYAYITLPDFESLSSSGATDVKCPSPIENNEFHLEASGASSVLFNDVKFDYLESSITGAADVKMTGTATTHNLTVTGAGNFKGKGLVTEKTIYDLSGASDASLNVTGEVVGNKKGASSVSYTGNPKTTINTEGSNKSSGSYVVYSDNYYDSVKVKVGGIKVEVYEGDDSVRVVVGNKELRVDEDGNVRFRRCKPNKFNGHWAGFEIGMNGYVNPDFNMSFPKDYEYMDLRMTKSIVVNINVFEQNVPFSKNQKWGALTGLGMSWNNYRFSRDTRLNSDSSQLIGYIDQGISIRKTKLTAFYLNVPVLFEFQTNSRHKKNSFHVAAGMVMNVRLSTHTKKYYNELNKEFEVSRYNPEIDNYETEFTATSPNYSKAKTFDDYFLQPVKFDATLRIGWGWINLFTTLSVNQMFKQDKGPELYPWTVGITLVNF